MGEYPFNLTRDRIFAPTGAAVESMLASNSRRISKVPCSQWTASWQKSTTGNQPRWSRKHPIAKKKKSEGPRRKPNENQEDDNSRSNGSTRCEKEILTRTNPCGSEVHESTRSCTLWCEKQMLLHTDKLSTNRNVIQRAKQVIVQKVCGRDETQRILCKKNHIKKQTDKNCRQTDPRNTEWSGKIHWKHKSCGHTNPHNKRTETRYSAEEFLLRQTHFYENRRIQLLHKT